jgi:hypothetical protein
MGVASHTLGNCLTFALPAAETLSHSCPCAAAQLEWNMKLWWPVNEAMIAFAMAYEETLECVRLTRRGDGGARTLASSCKITALTELPSALPAHPPYSPRPLQLDVPGPLRAGGELGLQAPGRPQARRGA